LPWHPDLASFENGVKIGCLICLLVQEYLNDKQGVIIDDLQGCTGRRFKSIADLHASRIRLKDDAESRMELALEFDFRDPFPSSSPPASREPSISAYIEILGFGKLHYPRDIKTGLETDEESRRGKGWREHGAPVNIDKLGRI
jgi:hypothetical protein